MTIRWTFGAAVLAACVVATAAQAKTKVLAKAGTWDAFGGTTTKGLPLCGISSMRQGDYFSLRYFSTYRAAIVQIGKPGWRIKDGAKQNLTLRFDQNPPWHATASGTHLSYGDAGLEFSMNRKQIGDFMRQFAASRQMAIHFDGSNAKDWVIKLNGVTAVRNAFEACDRKLK